jgi:hypothetical protein
MSVQAMSWVFDHSETVGGARLVLLAIANHHNRETGTAFPSYDTIAREARLSRSAVRRAVERLEASGELLVERPETNGRGRSNRYWLVGFDAPEERARHAPIPERGKGASRTGKGAFSAVKGRVDAPLTIEPTQEPTNAEPKPLKDDNARPARQSDPRADEVTRAWWDRLDPKPMQKYVAVRAIVSTALRAGHRPDAVAAALDRVDLPVVAWRLEQVLRSARPAPRPSSGLDALSRQAEFGAEDVG